MLQATPFDLCLFTGAGILPVDDLEIQQMQSHKLFCWCSEKFIETNQRLSKNLALQGCQLVVPMTQELFEALQDTPSWHAVRSQPALRLHKSIVLRFLRSNNQNGGSPILHLAQDNTHLYAVTTPADFFIPGQASELQAAWNESSGTCVFGHAQSLEPAESARITATWVISPGRGHRPSQVDIQAQSIEIGGRTETSAVPMLAKPFMCPNEIESIDIWPWECLVRQALWQDERLPFYGPNGPFNFRPNSASGWHPGQRLSSAPGHVHGYLDDLSGIWQWEDGRAAHGTPFAGHWNVQLAGSGYNRWERYLSDCFGQSIRLRSDHINVEPDGSIVDDTFDRF